jgi:hypothetical protein
MELLQTIALLCQLAGGDSSFHINYIRNSQIRCHQSYLNCVLKRKSTMTEKDALERCVLEK